MKNESDKTYKKALQMMKKNLIMKKIYNLNNTLNIGYNLKLFYKLYTQKDTVFTLY